MGTIVQGRQLWNALFPLTRQRVLGLLFGNPDKSFFANEIVRIAQVGTGSVQRELARLAEAGLITTHRVGNQKHYRANRESPFYPEIRSLVVKTWGTFSRLRSLLQQFEGDIRLALLYGSAIDDLASPGTPLGLLVVGENLSRERMEKTIDPLARQIDRPIQLSLLSPERYDRQRVIDGSALNAMLAGPTRTLIAQENDPG